jgi:hypothetical protein
LTAEGSGTVLEWIATDGSSWRVLRMCGVQGEFSPSGVLSFVDNKGDDSQCGVVSTTHKEDLKYRTGELTYIQNTQPITRNLEQKEEIEVLFQF